MTVPVAPPANPARVATPGKSPAAGPPGPRAERRFAALLEPPPGRECARANRERAATPSSRHRDAGKRGEDDPRAGDPLGELLGGGAAGGVALACPAAAAGVPAVTPDRGADEVAAQALAAHLVESVQVGLDRAGQAEVRFEVADGRLRGLEVRLCATARGIEATFLAEDAATRRSLAEPLALLARTLAERGVTVARIEVAVRPDVGGGRGSRDGRDGAGAAAPAGVAAPGNVGVGAAGGAVGLPAWRGGSPTDWVA